MGCVTVSKSRKSFIGLRELKFSHGLFCQRLVRICKPIVLLGRSLVLPVTRVHAVTGRPVVSLLDLELVDLNELC